jgi:hypothetical protein
MSTAEQMSDMDDKPTLEELEAEKAAELSKGGEQDEAAKLAADEAAKKAADDAAAAKAAQDAADADAKAKADADAAAAAEAKKLAEKPDDAQTLRALAREQKRELDRTHVELERMRRQLEKSGLVDEEDKKLEAAEQAKIKEAYDAKMASLSIILEAMKVNPKFEDVDQVVSQDNFDDLVEAMAKVYVQENGGSLAQATKMIEGHIWNQPNPYLYAYERIKAYHPKYRKPADDPAALAKIKADEEEAKAKAGKAKEPVNAPGSVAGMAGAGSGPGGWTSAMIEELEEEDLPTVPRETYEKYLRGELK